MPTGIALMSKGMNVGADANNKLLFKYFFGNSISQLLSGAQDETKIIYTILIILDIFTTCRITYHYMKLIKT